MSGLQRPDLREQAWLRRLGSRWRGRRQIRRHFVPAPPGLSCTACAPHDGLRKPAPPDGSPALELLMRTEEHILDNFLSRRPVPQL
ncbi:MAG: hypothetical protein M0Z54_00545 [Thermaerobacter sp.]|nr:hypothetical protein [Thermaerobacter sp.]